MEKRANYGAIAAGLVVATTAILANVHGSLFLDTVDDRRVVLELTFGWPMPYAIRFGGPIDSIQWIFLEQRHLRELSPMSLFLNVLFCFVTVASTIYVIDSWQTLCRLKFGLKTLLKMVTLCAIFVAVYVHSFSYSIHWFSVAADWPNYVLMWLVNAVLSLGIVCDIIVATTLAIQLSEITIRVVQKNDNTTTPITPDEERP